MMQWGITNRNLYVRQNRPSVNAPSSQYYAAGQWVRIVDTVIGDRYKDNATWYFLDNGHYVWSGGITLRESPRITSDPNDLATRLKMQLPIPDGRGKGATVAILDSGMTHPLLTPKIWREHNFVADGASARDQQGHGTKIGGLMAADTGYLRSLSSACRLINYRVADAQGIVMEDPVIAALRDLISLADTPDVVNMSFDISFDAIPRIQPLIDQLAARGAVVVVAGGNNNITSAMATLQHVVSVGAVTKERWATLQTTPLDPAFHAVWINEPLVSTAMPDASDTIGRVSAYTALTSSLLAAYLQHVRHQHAPAERLPAALAFLAQAARPWASLQQPDILTLLKP